MISIDIDTLYVKDIKDFINKNFPEKDFPNGVPSDFKNEEFEKYTAPLKEKKSDNDVCFIRVKYRYKFFNPFFNRDMENIEYSLYVEDGDSYKYVLNDLSKEQMWTAPQDYLIEKMDQQLDSITKNMF